ncbi:alpha-glucosidase [Desemzia sp. RIT804]|uniref:alpha-amylase family glycosyl hydrolase n=1 Tax=Desemzia sp. RIT 804 TaxID=2810209 RepID=UPI001950CA73|nr:alpha-amylase family glycosyl hydrolase [Desemzia sp. RIT 804]MBM6615706.1 alpha-glucosidase [Desemzia sp. RIT 804]
MTNKKWWEEAIIYQVYPRSFQDTNEDGVGDIEGIIQRLDYIQSLGVNTLWLTPVVLSNQEDNGYDVIDYKQVDPLFGTQEQGEKLIEEVHKRGLKLIYDFPLHHTSTEHPWFKNALKGKDNPYRNYYIWADAVEGQEYPTNWTAELGESVWTKEENSDQFYLHLFMQSMADLNWDNPRLRKEMLDILGYLIELGIDGFRLDAFIYMSVDKSFPNHPDKKGPGTEVVEYGEKLEEYLNEIKAKIEQYEKDIFLIGEATSANAELTRWYTDPTADRIDKIITLHHFPEKTALLDDRLMKSKQAAPLDLKAFKDIQNEFQQAVPENGGPILYWNNHDEPRHQDKYGNTTNFRDNSQTMMATLLYLQKGIPIIYYGEEIGMTNFEFEEPDKIKESETMIFYNEAKKIGWKHEKIMYHLNLTSRATSRGLMQWNDSEKVGFTTANNPWTLYNRESKYNVQEQEKDKKSILHFYRKLIALKKSALFRHGDYVMHSTKESLYVYERSLGDKSGRVYANFSDVEETIKLSEDWASAEIVLANNDNKIDGKNLVLSPYGAVVFIK